LLIVPPPPAQDTASHRHEKRQDIFHPVSGPQDLTGAAQPKTWEDLEELFDRHDRNYQTLLLNAANGGPVDFTPEPTEEPTDDLDTSGPTAEPTVTMEPTVTASPTISPEPTVTASPTTAEPTLGAEPTPAPTTICFSTAKTDGSFGDLTAQGEDVPVTYRYEVELLPEGAQPLSFEEVERPDGWGWGGSGGTPADSAGGGGDDNGDVTSPAMMSRAYRNRGHGRRAAVPSDLLSGLVNVETLHSRRDHDVSDGGGRDQPGARRRRLQDGDANGDDEPDPAAQAAVATLTNEILPKLEVAISDSLLPVLFEDECGGDIGRTSDRIDPPPQSGGNPASPNKRRQLQEEQEVVALSALPPDVAVLGEACQVIIPEGQNTCTVVEGELTLRVTGDTTDTSPLEEQTRSVIREGMGPTGRYRLADGRIVRLAYAPQVIPESTEPEGFSDKSNESSIPVYPFIIAALVVVALIGGLLFYRRRLQTRDHQSYDEDGNPMGDGVDSGYDDGYAPPDGDMMQLEGGDQGDDYGDYGDSLGGSQQQNGGYINDGYRDGGGGGYNDDGYDDGYGGGGDGGGFDTIQEEGADGDDWGDAYGVNENESAMQNSMDEYSEYR